MTANRKIVIIVKIIKSKYFMISFENFVNKHNVVIVLSSILLDI